MSETIPVQVNSSTRKRHSGLSTTKVKCSISSDFPDVLKDNVHFLCGLARSKTFRVMKKMISGASNKNLEALSLLAWNLLQGNLQLHNKDFAALTPYADQIRKMAKRRMSLKSRQKVLTKKEDFYRFY